MDIVVSFCLSIVACAAEREEVRKCIELLKKLINNADARMRMQKEGKREEKEDNEGEATQGVEERKEDKNVERRGDGVVSWGVVAGSEAQRRHCNSRLERRVQ
ncbi:uncharacterized protein FOMMEDRAFT_159400 [Fomitiporia mediterranea MF3/22]|uniref:uncharacterized protein n=1 Tax=Fomitiporia mediterranea (strain MF3/22) TaxID=694068 RepID=UPI0004409063|nr:uncharacterized protein FOMMEDRAFT_159400 [Fomitiporia mediterranea MF3/22]EJD00636.1 hypothetical protein FOMMEDRAFT_159400 [Fomitiporia mediterranea MF3/22]